MLLIQRLLKQTPTDNPAYEKLQNVSDRMEAANGVLDHLTSSYKRLGAQVQKRLYQNETDFLITGREP